MALALEILREVEKISLWKSLKVSSRSDTMRLERHAAEGGVVMGVVPMESMQLFSYHGDAYVSCAVYIYCDNCGSFNLKKCLSLRQWLLIIGSCSFVAAILYLESLKPHAATPYWLTVDGVALLLFVLAGIGVTVYGLWGFHAYRCRKCGKFTTIRYNTRDYPSDASIVDVPEQRIQKYYLRGWPDDQPIEAYLSPPKDTKRNE